MYKKYSVNEESFIDINADTAWVIGWIMSDGCITKNRVVISVSEIDEEVLHKIKDILKYNGPIYRFRGSGYSPDKIK